MAKKQKYYVVWKGVSPGVYHSWTDCQLQIKGYEGALYKSFDTREEAEQAFASSAFHYVGKNAVKKEETPRQLPENFFFFKQKTAYDFGTGDWSSDVCSSDLKNRFCNKFACI